MYSERGWHPYQGHSPKIAVGDKFSHFETALAYIEKGRSGYDRPIGKHGRIFIDCGRDTPLGQEGTSIRVRLYGTDIITLWPNGATTFDTGGWHTRTTSTWMAHNKDFSVHLYEPRGMGGRKPYKYSSIRSLKRERSFEERLRKKYGLPSLYDMRYLSVYELTGEWDAESLLFDGELSEMLDQFHAELDDKMPNAAPYYVFEDGITFSKRGACLTEGAVKLDVAIARERREYERERWSQRAAMSVAYKAIRRLRRGLRLPNCEACDGGPGYEHVVQHLTNRSVSAEMIRYATESWLCDRGKDSREWHYWLNLHHRGYDLAIGGPGLPRAVEPHIRGAMYRWMRAKTTEPKTPF